MLFDAQINSWRYKRILRRRCGRFRFNGRSVLQYFSVHPCPEAVDVGCPLSRFCIHMPSLSFSLFAPPTYHWTVHFLSPIAAPDFPILPVFVGSLYNLEWILRRGLTSRGVCAHPSYPSH